MPIFNVQGIQRITKRLGDSPIELSVVDRVVFNESGIVALDPNGAVAIAGRKIPADYDAELLTQLVVTVQKVA